MFIRNILRDLPQKYHRNSTHWRRLRTCVVIRAKCKHQQKHREKKEARMKVIWNRRWRICLWKHFPQRRGGGGRSNGCRMREAREGGDGSKLNDDGSGIFKAIISKPLQTTTDHRAEKIPQPLRKLSILCLFYVILECASVRLILTVLFNTNR